MTDTVRIGEPNGWRGEMGARVLTLERQVQTSESHLANLMVEVTSARRDMAVMRVELGNLTDDVSTITKALDVARAQDLNELQATIERSRTSTRNMLFYLLAPLVVLVIGGLILYAVTGSTHGAH